MHLLLTGVSINPKKPVVQEQLSSPLRNRPLNTTDFLQKNSISYFCIAFRQSPTKVYETNPSPRFNVGRISWSTHATTSTLDGGVGAYC